MITKERLQELIEQGATIWTVNKSGNINPVKTNKSCEIQRQYLMKEGQIYSYIEQTFETKEEAEWHREFGRIERTITLDLPIWEEIEKDKNFHYIRHYVINKNFSLFIEIYKFTKTISISWSGGIYKKDPRFNRNWELTKENYYEACRKAKELFLGGSNDTN